MKEWSHSSDGMEILSVLLLNWDPRHIGSSLDSRRSGILDFAKIKGSPNDLWIRKQEEGHKKRSLGGTLQIPHFLSFYQVPLFYFEKPLGFCFSLQAGKAGRRSRPRLSAGSSLFQMFAGEGEFGPNIRVKAFELTLFTGKEQLALFEKLDLINKRLGGVE